MRQIMLMFMLAIIASGMPLAYGANSIDENPAANNKEADFWSTFGIGLAVTTNLGRERSIQEAQLVNGIIRVTSERQIVPRLMLEKHWFPSDTFHEGCKCKNGIFVGVSLLGDKQIMDAIALGYIAGFKPNTDGSSHNLGVGFALQPYSRVLGDGLSKNQPLPVGETAIRYKETNRTSLIFFYTYTLGSAKHLDAKK